MIRALFALVFLLGFQSLIHAQERRVALELVLAVDTSASVDEREFDLQRRGIAEAFAHPDLIGVIEGMGSAGIAVMVLEWSGTGMQTKVVDWSLLTDRASSIAFSNAVLEAPRAPAGSTDIGSAVNFAIDELDQNRFSGNRRVIDVSGDGNSTVNSSAKARDRAILKGITVNGLVVLDKENAFVELAEVDLIQHYSNRVIGGNGAFLMTANGFDDFRNAMLKKLLKEILGNGIADSAP